MILRNTLILQGLMVASGLFMQVATATDPPLPIGHPRPDRGDERQSTEAAAHEHHLDQQHRPSPPRQEEVDGLQQIRRGVTGELSDIARALRSLDQSYSFRGMRGCGSCTAGSAFADWEAKGVPVEQRYRVSPPPPLVISRSLKSPCERRDCTHSPCPQCRACLRCGEHSTEHLHDTTRESSRCEHLRSCPSCHVCPDHEVARHHEVTRSSINDPVTSHPLVSRCPIDAAPDAELVRRNIEYPAGWQPMQPSLVFAVVTRFPAEWDLMSTQRLRSDWLTPGNAMVYATGIEELIPRLAQDLNEWSIEATLDVANRHDIGRQTLVTSQAGDVTNFSLSLDSRRLLLELNLTDDNGKSYLAEVPLGTLPTGKQHVIVSYRRGEVNCFVNGKSTTRSSAVRGDFSRWTEAGVLLGSQGGDAVGLTGVVLYGRFIADEEANNRFRLAATRFGL